MTQKKDQIYINSGASSKATVGSFKFDDRVARVFEDMISRSVPGYSQILSMLPTLTRQFQFANLHYYDLGCSLGAAMLAMARGLGDLPHTLVGIDNSAPMIARAEANLDGIPCELIEQDILDAQLQAAGMVVMNFTLQFIPLGQRQALVTHIYEQLCPGGALILSEKIKFDDPLTHRALIGIRHQYKADQGYSDLEISQKRDAIEDVLIPETLESHTARLKDAGFSVITPWVQNLQFVSLLAIK